MIAMDLSLRNVVLAVVVLPVAVFSAWICWLVVPEIIRVVVPAVVRAVLDALT